MTWVNSVKRGGGIRLLAQASASSRSATRGRGEALRKRPCTSPVGSGQCPVIFPGGSRRDLDALVDYLADTVSGPAHGGNHTRYLIGTQPVLGGREGEGGPGAPGRIPDRHGHRAQPRLALAVVQRVAVPPDLVELCEQAGHRAD